MSFEPQQKSLTASNFFNSVSDLFADLFDRPFENLVSEERKNALHLIPWQDHTVEDQLRQYHEHILLDNQIPIRQTPV
jgi:hypothetical protein